MSKAELYSIIFESLKARLAGLGYKPGSNCFGRAFNNLLYSVALYKLPRSPAGELQVVCEACVYSAEVDLKLGEEPDPTWPSSQIRVRLDNFRPRAVGAFQPPMTCRTPEEATALADEIWNLLEAKALPITHGIRSTEDMISIFRKGPYTLKSRARANYDADVLEGKIDPKRQPFVYQPPSSAST